MSFQREVRRLEKLAGDQENFYIIRRCAARLGRDGRFPARLCRVIEALCRETGCAFDSIRLAMAIREAQQADGDFTMAELCRAYDCTTVAMVRCLLAVYRGEIFGLQERNALFESAVTTLRKVMSSDFDHFFAGVCAAEEVLRRDPVYCASTRETRQQYRDNVARYARRHHIGEREAAETMGEKAGLQPTHPRAGRLYFILLYGGGILLTILLCMLTGSAISFLCLFPLWELCKRALDFLYARFLKPGCVPALALPRIPASSRTLAVTTTLLYGGEADDEIFNRLERYYLANRDANLRFGILGDLRDSVNAVSGSDEEILAHAAGRIEALNMKYRDTFYLFIRGRVYSASERKFIGYERKRGAVCALAKLLTGGDSDFTQIIGDRTWLDSVKYVITLDADTELGLGAAREMVGAISHPLNRPVIRNGRVVSGYGIMQPRTATALESASRTPYSVMLTGSGGADIYASASCDLYQTLYGEGIFCGKGIFDTAVFAQMLCGRFPEERILSHDILEGCYLRAAGLNTVELMDSCPKNPVSESTRRHRWIRGDIQSLPFARAPLNRLSKYKLWDNLRRTLNPVWATAALFFLPALTAGRVWYLAGAVGFLIFPVITALITSARTLCRRFYSRVIPLVRQSLVNVLYELTALPFSAIVALDAVGRSLFRMTVTHRHMLEWVTSSESDARTGGFRLYLRHMWPASLAGLAMLAFPAYGGLRLLGFLWFVFPVIAWYSGRPYVKKPGLSDADRRTVTGYASDMWRMFAELVTGEENHLPPDNYQLSPSEEAAHRTSPTNIGLYLLSCLAARDFGFIGSRELSSRIRDCLRTVMTLEKWQGHLYNWYDTHSLAVIGGRFVSSVDSGNFITSLVALREGLKQYLSEDMTLADAIAMATQLIDAADFSALYDRERRLFFIGFNTDTGEASENHYDLFMSEARTMSYYAAASGQIPGPKAHWRTLGRYLTSSRGYIGLMSWTGTMFEYYMPTLLLPVYDNSLSAEGLHFAWLMQRRGGIDDLWGKSESGYYAFDGDMNYQYKAFGIQKLGFKQGLADEMVLAPYAAFLVLPFVPGPALGNLRRFERIGMYGRYGFYEAVDFTASRVGRGHAAIRSYMAHHVGMSLIASANACFRKDDGMGIFQHRFMSCPEMACAHRLLGERIPVDAPVYRAAREETAVPALRGNIRFPASNPVRSPGLMPASAVISNGRCRIEGTSDGDIALFEGRCALTSPIFDIHDHRHTLTVCFEADGKRYRMTDGIFSYAEDYIRYTLREDDIRATLTLSVHGEKNVFCAAFEASGRFTAICPMLYFEPVMNIPADYLAHPAFSDLSLEAGYRREEEMLVFTRRPRLERERGRSLAVSMETGGKGREFETQKDRILPVLYTEEDIKAVAGRRLTGAEGACVLPVCVMKKRLINSGGRFRCTFLIASGRDDGEAMETIKTLRRLYGGRNGYLRGFCTSIPCGIFACLRPYTVRSVSDQVFAAAARLCGETLLSEVIYARPLADKRPLWQYAVSGDLPVVTAFLDRTCFRKGSMEETAGYLTGVLIAFHRSATLRGLRFDLVLCFEESEKYGVPHREALRRLAESFGVTALMMHRGGIHLVDGMDARQVLTECSCAALTVTPASTADRLFARHSVVREKLPVQQIAGAGSVSQGDVLTGFCEDGYMINTAACPALWSYIYCSPQFGTLVQSRTAGFTWFRNSREGRMTPWRNDVMLGDYGERVTASWQGQTYDLCACASSVCFDRGAARYEGTIGDYRYSVRIGVDRRLPVKLIAVEGDWPKGGGGDEEETADTVAETPVTVSYTADIAAHGGKKAFVTSPVRGCFLLGYAASPETFDYICAHFRSRDDFMRAYRTYAEEVSAETSTFHLSCGNAAMEEMFNFYLPYQMYRVRMLARTGYYQSGGAYGFRDQLQDAMAAFYLSPRITKIHILRCAAHQYEEGDVMHWWHPAEVDFGVRTRCSDDYLWLSWAVAEYCDRVGGGAIDEMLSFRVRYLTSLPLGTEERERLEYPARTEYKETIYEHCMRALKRGFALTGAHGLPLMGNCDWNDGMSLVGESGGESVWLSFFLRMTAERFLPLCMRIGDRAGEALLREGIQRQMEAQSRCWEGDRYVRAYFGDGSPLGSVRNDECAIDLLPQAFAAMLDCGGAAGNTAASRAHTAMDTAYRLLYDKKCRLFRLFTPPFDHPERDPGYIRGYAPGLRENGGQYTHAAVWGAAGLYAAGEYEKGFAVLDAINPASRTAEEVRGENRVYRAEPYFLAGDVYTAAGHEGQGGWSLYTGAAAWYYRTVLETVCGYREEGGCFSVHPRLSDSMPAFDLIIDRFGTRYIIHCERGDADSCMADGKIVNNVFYFDKKRHFVKITVEK